MLLTYRGRDVAMLSYFMRQTLLDALAAGPPYQILPRPVAALDEMECLRELEQRGLITSGPIPVLTDAGIAEAKWFADPDSQKSGQEVA